MRTFQAFWAGPSRVRLSRTASAPVGYAVFTTCSLRWLGIVLRMSRLENPTEHRGTSGRVRRSCRGGRQRRDVPDDEASEARSSNSTSTSERRRLTTC
jgi:hypothetical protein